MHRRPRHGPASLDRHGVARTVTYECKRCGVIQRLPSAGAPAALRSVKESDLLLIFLLKAHRPEKYRERHEVTLVEARAGLARLLGITIDNSPRWSRERRCCSRDWRAIA